MIHMKNSFYFLILACLLLIGCQTNKTTAVERPMINLILDTDLGPDYDDVGAMAVMHALADSGYVHILGTVSCNIHEMVVPCIEVLNVYFGRPNLPIGAPKLETAPNLTSWHNEKWTEYLPAHYPHTIKKTADAPDAVAVYRKILSEADDQTVTICTVGFFTNLSGLLQSSGDEYSPLSGVELVKQKVVRLVSMAGLFPEGKEFNVIKDAPASKVVVEQWPTEIIFSGFEIGEKILTGTSVIQMPVENSPVKDAYRLSMAEGDKEGRMSWDQTTVLVAIKGVEPYYAVERGTVQIVDDEGTNHWVSSENGKHLRLIEKMPVAEVTSIIENYMKHQPILK